MKHSRTHRVLWLALLLCAPAFAAGADAWDFSGHLAVETRHFTQGPQWPGQESQPGRLAIEAVPEARWRSDDGNQRASLIPFLRWDATDEERSLIDLREAYWALRFDSAELLVGINTVFWGVTESVHLVDIVNQTDAVDAADGEEKLGQPMVALSLVREWGIIDAYLLPGFRERTFPGEAGRLRVEPLVIVDDARFEHSDAEQHVDLALRYAHTLGDWDFGLSYFNGTSRDPDLVPEPRNGTLVVVPFYEQIQQGGLDVQWVDGAWLWKLESIYRRSDTTYHSAAALGFEYTLYGLFDTAADLGLIAEYLYDSRQEKTLFGRDIATGLRLALNDVAGSELLLVSVVDSQSGETVWNLEASRRVGERFTLALEASLFHNTSTESIAQALRDDDFVQLTAAWHF